jgi:hypothetical protein
LAFSLLLWGDALFVASDKASNLIKLEAFAGQVTHMLVMADLRKGK